MTVLMSGNEGVDQAPEFSRRFSTFPFDFYCHDIFAVITYFQVWSRLFFVHMNTATVNFVLSICQIREPFCAHIQCSFDHSLRSIVDDNLMTVQMIMIATGHTW